jgi:hypothetical protein
MDNILVFLKSKNDTLKINENWSNSIEKLKIDEENGNKEGLIGNCLDFYLMKLLRCVDVILNKIGEGGFGSVYLCSNGKENKSDLFVVKYIKSSKSIDSAERERRFGYVSKLNSPYLVKYRETFTFNNDLCVVMEYFEDGNLHDFIKRYQKKNQRIKEKVYFYLECLCL